MNKSPLSKVLLAVAAILALWSLYLCYTFISRAGQIRTLQLEVNRLAQKQQVFNMLMNDAAEYAKTHPAIEPVLQSIRTPKAASSATPVPAATPKPGTK